MCEKLWLRLFAAISVMVIVGVSAHPTMYKWNDNRKLEPDLVPVSSTVIPLPVYKVAHSIQVLPSSKREKIVKPNDGEVTLITAYNKKKVIPTNKKHLQDVSLVKQLPKEIIQGQ